MRLIMLSLLLLAAPAVCNAEIYKWIDEKGQVGFADDLGKVPRKYRDKAVINEKQEQSVEIIEKTEPEKIIPKGTESRGEASDSKEKDKAKPLFAGKSGESWKQDFARQKHVIKTLRDDLAEIKERMKEGDKISRNEYLSLQNTMRDLEVRSARAQKKLDDLSEAADQAELPIEFR